MKGLAEMLSLFSFSAHRVRPAASGIILTTENERPDRAELMLDYYTESSPLDVIFNLFDLIELNLACLKTIINYQKEYVNSRVYVIILK